MFEREDLRQREVQSAGSAHKVQRKLSDLSKISQFDISTAFQGKFAKDMGFYVHAKEDQTIQKKTGNVIQRQKFIGNKAAVHIHAEGRYYHIKNSRTNERFNFNQGNPDQVQEAYRKLQQDQQYQGPGNLECQRWMERNLGAG